MAIKIIRAHESFSQLVEGAKPSLHVEIEIDGYKWAVGGLDPSLNRVQLIALLDADHDDMLRQAKQQVVPETYPKQRLDLLDEQPRDLAVEIDDLKAKVEKMEMKIRP